MNVAQRIKELRTELNLSQKDFAARVEMTQAALSAIEKEIRGVPDKTIKLICFEFDVNENWLKNGVGEKFSKTFSLDKYAKSHGASDLELEILKEFFGLPPDMRQALLALIRTSHNNQKVAPAQTIKSESEPQAEHPDIEEELAAYRQELLAEKKGTTLSASPDTRNA